MRRIAGFFLVPSLIALIVGLANLGSLFQIGGADGFILEAGHLVLGSLLLGGGSVLVLWGDSTGRSGMVPIGVVLMLIAAGIVIGYGQWPSAAAGD